ncbi:MAG: hypothetical protein PHO37_17605 [Kiritimatiellae bacterium]|nr:hypothetical protein [Kiritimatiellia bacterium]
MKSLGWLFCYSLVFGYANGVTVNESTLPDSGFADLETSRHIKIVPLDLTRAAGSSAGPSPISIRM